MCIQSLLFHVTLLLGAGHGFNIDVTSPVLHSSDQPDSMFGFSVAVHSSSSAGNSLLVGAPRYHTEQRGVRRGGAVLRCAASTNDSCQYVPFDSHGNIQHPLGGALDQKSGQWFGATLVSSSSGTVVACAPRYTWFTENLQRREPVGTCFVARDDLSDFQEYSPCRTRQWGYHRQGSCQAGFGAAVSKSGERMYIGAPGAFYWQGQVHSQSLRLRNDYHRTREGLEEDDDQYLGYSVASADFNGDGIPDVALGVPKGQGYIGKIAVYTNELVNLENITGDQLGSYYGYSLAVTDFNNDGRDDLVVGAPLYTDYLDKEMKIEVGRVYVLLQTRNHRLRTAVTLTGDVTKGRFGLSVAAIGDINKDGFQDIAVGAPYGGPDGLGAVYIYNGFSITTFETAGKVKPSQIIYSREVAWGLNTFGWSLSGGYDMDDNQYSDVVVGAYLSNTAVILRSRPVVTMSNRTLSFLSADRLVKVEDAQCAENAGLDMACVPLQLCLQYSGVGVGPQIEMEIEYTLDGKVNEPRMVCEKEDQLVTQMSERVVLRKDVLECSTKTVYVRPNLNDKLSPLTAEVSYSLVSDAGSRRFRRNQVLPILDGRYPSSVQDSLGIKNDCGGDDVCIPDLIVNVGAPEIYVLGKKDKLTLNVRVANDGEHAFQSAVYIPVPAGLHYSSFTELENTSSTCSPRTRGDETTVVCNIGNPLKGATGVVFDVEFQQGGPLNKPVFEFLISANSTNQEPAHTKSDNYVNQVVEVNVNTALHMYGTSEPLRVDYNKLHYVNYSSGMHEEEYGPEIIHKYVISNKGTSEILLIDIIILWPSKSDDDDLLYLLENPLTQGAMVCEPEPGVNPMQLQLYNRKDTYRRLKLSGSQSLSSLQQTSSEQSKQESRVNTVTGTSGAQYNYGSAAGAKYDYGAAAGNEQDLGIHGKASWYSASGQSSSSSSGSSTGGYSVSTYSESSSSSSSGSSYKTSSAKENLITHGRTRRELDEEPEVDWETETQQCSGGASNCTVLRCTAGPLSQDDQVSVSLRSRLHLPAVEKETVYTHKDVQVSSKLVARVRRLPQSVNPDLLKVRTVSVTTPVSPLGGRPAPPTPWWVYLLGVLLGLLLLLAIVGLLYKCGFFNRRRP